MGLCVMKGLSNTQKHHNSKCLFIFLVLFIPYLFGGYDFTFFFFCTSSLINEEEFIVNPCQCQFLCISKVFDLFTIIVCKVSLEYFLREIEVQGKMRNISWLLSSKQNRFLIALFMIYLGHCYVTENQHKSNSKAKRKD